MALLYGRAGRLTAKNGGFRPGQYHLYARFIHSMPMFSNLGKEIINHLSRLVETTYYVKVRTLGECGDSAPL